MTAAAPGERTEPPRQAAARPDERPGATGAATAMQERGQGQVQAQGQVQGQGQDDRGLRALHSALSHLSSLQRPGGGWEGEMVWCTMILSQYVITQQIIRGRGSSPFSADERAAMIRSYEVSQNRDGSFGLHGESGGYVFTTTIGYVALRLLGLPVDHPLCAAARAWVHRQPGGVLSIPTWGKFWLALCNLYGWEGVNPCPPELFLLPSSLPIHPDNYYCHTRYIYLGIAYLSGRRFCRSLGPLQQALREELYPGARYEDIPFSAHRHDLAPSDLFVRPSAGLRLAYDLLWRYDRRPIAATRQKALEHCLGRILYEQRQSRYQAISPVNGLLNCLALFDRSPSHPDLGPSLAGLESWRFEDAAEGRRYAGAHSIAWDTAFSLQALLSAPTWAGADRTAEIRAGYAYLDRIQMQSELPHHADEHRDPILGGWCFSDGEHRWAVSDCTAEALCAILLCHERPGLIPTEMRISNARLVQAARFILNRQNQDGGFGTYERRRGSRLLEWVNPSEMYGSCMTERSYIECTASCVAALSHFRQALPGRLGPEINLAIRRGVRRLRRAQRADGSFLGFWGINFTYAAFHVVKGLRSAGVQAHDQALQRLATWLEAHQRPDGGWGEHYTSCLHERYVEHPQSQVVMTSWAILALCGVRPDSPAVQRGVAWLSRVQGQDGGFPQQAQNGVFFGTAMLDYRLYKSYFPAWALGTAAALTRP